MSCSCAAAERHFDRAIARRDLDRYRKHGPGPTTRALIDVVRRFAPRDATLLDVGAGIGVIHHELLGASVRAAIHVEAASAYLTVAKEESERRGTAVNVRFVHGDFVELSAELAAADIVTLDRVVCCYRDYERLIAASVAKSRAVYAISYPRDRWLVKLAIGFENVLRALTGNPFRTYVHPVRAIQALLTQSGFTLCHDGGTFAWRVGVYMRT